MLFLVKAFLYSIGATLLLTYLWTINIFKPIVDLVVKLRYLPFACVSFMFTQLSDNIEQVKNYILLFGLIPYFTASFVAEITEVVDNGKEINKSLINKNNFFETLLEVVIIGKIDRVFDVIKLNFAIAWTMIVSVECLAYNSGGLGTMIISGQKHLQLEKVYAIAIIILLIGIGIDKLISYLKKLTISYAI
jgi:NitT/TauT family transport system permease protein